ncbi:MAG: non-heme iron oxygenase ferredoxin subunit [Candidatus Anammoxibacter sp.]
MEDYKKIANVNDLNDGEAKKIEFDGKAIALFKIDGNYFATDDTCTHEKASISEGEIDGDIVSCPHHGARFDIKTGQALSLPAMFPLKTYQIKVDGNDIKIALE